MKRFSVPTILTCLLFSGAVMAGYDLKPYVFTIVDEFGSVVTDANLTITVRDQGTSNSSTIYADTLKTSKTNPITPGSDSAAAVGVVKFWGGATSYDILVSSDVTAYTSLSPMAVALTPTTSKIIFPKSATSGAVSSTTITASSTVALNGDTTIGNAVTDDLTVTAAIQGATPIYFDGATDNTIETILAVEDPTSSDKTVTLPAYTGAIMLSTLATNKPDVVNSVWGGTNQIIAEGATADSNEHIITFTDPGPTVADPTYTFPGTTGTVMLSTLATNGVDIANSIWGGTSQLIIEGSTANASELTIAFSDPNSDQTITVPNQTGKLITSNVYALRTTENMIPEQCYGGVFTNTGIADSTANLPIAVVGMKVTFVNTDANDITINPQNDASIICHSLTPSAGDAISSDKALGSTVTLVATTTTQWTVIDKIGTWADVN